MPRLPAGHLRSNWSDFLISLLRDLEPLGHVAEYLEDGQLSIGTTIPVERADYEEFWDRAHNLHHLTVVSARADTIFAFEAQHADIFVRMELFQPSANRPELEIVDFSNNRHRAIVDYLGLHQSVTSRKRVGRQMGLLLWDVGQTAHIPLMGAAVLASPRYSQRLRDQHLGWTPDHPRTSVHFDERTRAVRVAGLARMMQLSVACALPPYNVLSGAWLVALAPFTALGQEAFARAASREPDPDLAAVVTTTGKSLSGAPFRGHRLGQLSGGRIEAAPGASGNVFVRARPVDGVPSLRASFEHLVSEETTRRACDLWEAEKPEQFARARRVERASISYALRRLGLNRSIFQGNEMGVHIGMLGRDTLGHLASGRPRSARKRPRLEWDRVVAVWTRRFLPQSDTARDTATPETLGMHTIGRRRRLEAARAYPQERIPLSYLLKHPDDHTRLSVSDLAPAKVRAEVTD